MGRRPKPPIVDPELARFIAVADPSRWAILRLLADRPRSVQDVAREVGLSLPVTSRHLQRLRAAGVVSAERRGKTLLCALSPPHTAGGNWLARAMEGKGGARPHPAPSARVSVRRERQGPAIHSTASPTSSAPVARPPSLPRRELDDYLL